VHGRWCYLYRAIDRNGTLVDVLFSEHRDMAAAQAFFRSAKAVTGVTPDRVTTDGHDSYPRAIRTTLGKGVRHRCSRYLNNRLEQDHRGIKGRYRSMRGFKCPRSAARFCRAYDELRNFLRPRSRHHQHVPADCRRLLHLRRTATVLPFCKPYDPRLASSQLRRYWLARVLTEPVEHVFGHQHTSMGGKIVRTIGLVRAKAKIGLMNLVYNMSRFAFLELTATLA
jgi:hypothetical protein